jgi:hypothetical protein
MKKVSLTIITLTAALMSFGQTQCTGLTKSDVQCKNKTKDNIELCHLHNPNHVKKIKITSKVCNGVTKKKAKCKNKTKSTTQLCHLHNK